MRPFDAEMKPKMPSMAARLREATAGDGREWKGMEGDGKGAEGEAGDAKGKARCEESDGGV